VVLYFAMKTLAKPTCKSSELNWMSANVACPKRCAISRV